MSRPSRAIRPAARCAMTDAFGFARKASSSRRQRRFRHAASLASPSRARFEPCQATLPPTRRCSPERRRTCRAATPGASRSSGTGSARSRASRATTCGCGRATARALEAKHRSRRRGPARRAHARRLRARRRAVRVRRERRPALRALPAGRGRDRVRRLRPARARRRAGDRRALEPAARAARGADRAGRPIVVLSQVYDDGEALLAAARRRGLEGIMAKRVKAPYRPGRRSDDWRKIKLREEATLLIAGYTSGQGARAQARRAAPRHRRPRIRRQLRQRPLGRGHPRAARAARAAPARDLAAARRGRLGGVVRSRVTWVEPELACEVEFTEWTRDRRLRAPVFKRLAEEGAVQEPSKPSRELKLTNQDKVFFPDEKITKGDLLAYYRSPSPTCSCPTCATARSRSCAIRTASRASTSSRSRRPRTRRTGCAR